MNGVSKKHQCQHCDAGFTLNVFLQNHLKDAHVENGQYRCGECCCRFADLEKFDSHMAQQHGYQPNITAKRPSDEDSSLRCQRCRITFSNAAMLKSHMRQKHPDDEESSDEDDDEFEDEEELKPAEVSKPSEEINLQQRKSPPPPESKPENKCKFCKKIFHNEGMLRSHLRQKHADELESSEEEDDDDEYEPNFPPGELIEDEQTESAPVEDIISKQSVSISAAQVPNLSSGGEDRRDYDSRASGSLNDTTAIESRETESLSESTVIEPAIEENNTRNNEENYDLANSQHNEHASPTYSPAARNDDDDDDDGYFPTPTDFLVQTEYEMDEQESAVRSSNIEALINSINHDPEEPNSYTCDLCGSVYATGHALQNHKKTNHVDGGQFPCTSCSSVFASKPELVVHAEIVHRVIQQQQQQQQLLTPDFSVTMSAADSIMPCDLCFEKFTDGLELTIHKMRCHVPDGNSCEYCPCSFMTFNELREHQRSHSEFSDIQIIPGTIDVPSPISVYDPSKEFYCMECNVDYKSNAHLRNHTRSCHVPNGQYACDFCPCVFGSRSSLVSHKKKHNKERQVVSAPAKTSRTNVAPTATAMDSMQIYTCELCGVNFLSVTDYLKHKEESHVAGGTFACDICPCVFDAYEALKTHQNVFHGGFARSSSRASPQAPQPVLPKNQPKILQRSSGKVSLTCEICGMILASQRFYDAHMQKSHVEGGYACKLCPRSYASFHAIRTHMGMFHKQLLQQTESIESMYTLPDGVSPRAGIVNGNSKRGRNSKSAVVNDVSSEFEFKCNECDWILSDVTDLQNHKIQFHGFKPKTKTSQPIDEVTKIIQNDDDLTCSACNLKFKRPSETFSHRKRNHVQGGKFPCKRCKCVFSNAVALQAHDVAKHGDSLSTSPAKMTPTKSPPTTSTSKNNKEHVCNLCGRSYPMLSTLCAHKNRSHKPNGKPCDYCTCTFSSTEDLGLHCKKYHRQVKFAADLADVAKRGRGRPKRDKSGRFSCQYSKCGVACRNQSSLTSHIKTAHAGPIEVVTIDLDVEEAAPVSASAVRCEQCRIGFDTKQELASHRISVHEYDVIKMAIENPSMDDNGKYLCHFCSTVFSRFTAMVAHVKSYHGDENRLMCFECKEEFSSMAQLDLHRERVHGGVQVQEREEVEEIVPVIMSCTSLSLSGYEKPKQPKCELCGRVFLHSRSLWAHRKRSHVTDGKHGCEHCACGFGTLRGLQSHQLIYHGIRPEKKEKNDSWMIDCDECPETFTSERAFKTHKRRAHWEGENGVSCPDCYCTLASKAAVTVHRIRLHGYELPGSGEDSEKSNTDVVEPARDISTVQDTTQDYDDDYSEPHFDDHFDDGPPESTYEPITVEPHNDEPENVIVESNLSDKVQEDRVADAPPAPVKHACGNCRLTFGQLKFLVMHRKMRHGIQDNLCWICDEQCPTLERLLDHIESHETLEPAAPPESSPTKPATLAAKKSYATVEEISCDLCGLEFTLPAALNMHKTVAHVPGGKFPCKECPCVFGSGGSLANHARSHNKRKTSQRMQAASSRSPKSAADSGGGSASTKSKPVAKKKTSLPPPGKSDIIGLALSAAMANTTPVTVPGKISELLKPSCATCKKTDFPTLSSLRRHESECRKKAKAEKIFGNRPTLNCKLCTKKFTLAVALQDHMKKKHGIGADAPEGSDNVMSISIDISEDGKGKGPKGSRRTTKVQAPPPRPPTPPPPSPKKKTKFPCRDCNIIYKRKRVRDNHLMVCHPVNGSHGCDKCPFKFRLRLALMIHQKYIHGDGARKKKKKKKATKKRVIKKADLKPVQSVEVNGMDAPQTAVTTPVNGVEDKQQTPAEPQVTPGPEKTIEFGQVNGLVSPANATTAPSGTGDASAVKKPDEAQVNGDTKTKVKRKKRKRRMEKGFFSPQALRSRERLISWTEVMHPCKVCAMKFRRTSQLERHERINHPGYSEYLCEKCPSMTALSKELTYHEEIYHSDFISMGEALERRQRKRKLLSNNNDETSLGRPKKIIKLRPLRLDESLPLDLSNVIASFTCPGPIVQKNLRDRENFLRRKLKRRKGIHMCRVCRMMFFTKRGLSTHLNVHVGDKPFKCRFCGVLFRRYSSYHSHKKKHIAMNPRLEVIIKRDPLGRCSYCKETFRTVALADIHFEEVHPELKFLDMCEQASNLWKETTSVLNSVADNPSPNPTPTPDPQQHPLPSMPSLI